MFPKSIAHLRARDDATNRRTFLKLAVGAGAGLALGAWLPGSADARGGSADAAVFNPFV